MDVHGNRRCLGPQRSLDHALGIAKFLGQGDEAKHPGVDKQVRETEVAFENASARAEPSVGSGCLQQPVISAVPNRQRFSHSSEHMRDREAPPRS
jgi:hypothetical protein